MFLDKVHEEPYVLHAIPTTANQEIRVSLTEEEGRVYADLRVYLRDAAGYTSPTPQGITVPLDQLAELEMAVAKLRQVAERIRN